jgi:hypothetical protein
LKSFSFREEQFTTALEPVVLHPGNRAREEDGVG